MNTLLGRMFHQMRWLYKPLGVAAVFCGLGILIVWSGIENEAVTTQSDDHRLSEVQKPVFDQAVADSKLEGLPASGRPRSDNFVLENDVEASLNVSADANKAEIERLSVLAEQIVGKSDEAIYQEIDDYLINLSATLGIPADQAPTRLDMQAAYGDRILQQLGSIPKDKVIEVVRAERLLQTANVQPGQAANVSLSNASYMLLAPYAQEAGLCSGDMWDERGLMCNYVFGKDSARVESTWTDPETGTKQSIDEVPANSELYEILYESSRPVSTQTSNVNDAVKKVTPADLLKTAVGEIGDLLIPTAHAQSDDSDNVGQCANLEFTFHYTFVLRMEPIEFATLLYATTVGLPLTIDLVSDFIADEAEDAMEDAAKEQVLGDRNDNEQNSNSQQAYQACRNRGMGDREKADCEKDKDLTIISRETLISSFMELMTGKNVDGDDVSAGDVAKSVISSVFFEVAKQIIEFEIYGEVYLLGNIQSGVNDSDQIFALFPFGIQCSIQGCMDAIMQCAEFGDDVLACAARFVDEHDWTIRPPGSSLEHSVNTCHAQPVDYAAQPSYGELTSERLAIPYDMRLQTRFQVPPGIDTNGDGEPNGFDVDADNSGDENGNGQQQYYAEQDLYVCKPSRGIAGSPGHVCPPATQPPVTGLTDNSTNTNYAGPITPPNGIRADAPSITTDGTDPQPPEEIIPFWRWEFDKVVTGLPYEGNDPVADYNLIFAGIKSTKDTYDILVDEENRRNAGDPTVLPIPVGLPLPPNTTLPPLPVGANFRLFPHCSSTRHFPGETSPPGDGFWYWHGEKNENRKSSPISVLTAFALGYLDYSNTFANNELTSIKPLDFLRIPYFERHGQPNLSEKVWGVIFGAIAGGINAAHPSGVAYDICDSGFAVACGVLKTASSLGFVEDVTDPGAQGRRDDSGLYIAHGNRKVNGDRFFPMPEVDITFAQALNHAPVDPQGCTDGVAGLLQPTAFSLISVGVDEGGGSSPTGFSQASQDSNKTYMQFIVTRHGDVSGTSSVDYRTIDNTAVSGANGDFVAQSGTLTFLPGDTEEIIKVEINDDDLVEQPENIQMELSNSTEDILKGKNTVFGTIYDDEEVVSFVVLDVDDAEVEEGDEFNTTLRFPVKRVSGSRKKEVKLFYIAYSPPGTAAQDVDYQSSFLGSFTLPSGVSEDHIEVEVFGDYMVETAETMTLYVYTTEDTVFFDNSDADLSLPTQLEAGGQFVNSNGSLATNSDGSLAVRGIDRNIVNSIPRAAVAAATAEGTIIDNDELFQLIITNPVVDEGDDNSGSATFTVTRTGAFDKTIPLSYRTQDGTARGGSDFEKVDEGLQVFNPGEASIDLPIGILGDIDFERDENFVVEVFYPESDPTMGGHLASTFGTATINDDDGPSIVTIEDASVVEGNSGTRFMEFTVRRTGEGVKRPISIFYGTQDGTARVNDNDYKRASSQLVRFEANQTETVIRIVVNGDTKPEGDESFRVLLGLALQGPVILSNSSATGIIVTDDNPLPPTAVPDTATTDEDTLVIIDVLANDSDANGDVINITNVTQGNLGNATVEDGVIRYTPNAEVSGSDTFEYTITDSTGLSATTTVSVTINSVNDNPVAVDDAVTSNENTTVSVNVTLNDTDIDGDTLVIESISGPSNGTAVFDLQTIDYTPSANFHGTDTITYVISDGNGGTASAQLVITVLNVNDAPIANSDNAATQENQAINIDVLANDTDPDGDALSIVAVSQAAQGTVTIVGGGASIDYQPNEGYFGMDTFTYDVSDANGHIATATVNVTVEDVNQSPQAQDDSVAVSNGQTEIIQVTANDTDGDGDELVVISVSGADHGQVSFYEGQIYYTADDDYAGNDTVTYTIQDPSGATSTATVNLTVEGACLPTVSTLDSAVSLMNQED